MKGLNLFLFIAVLVSLTFNAEGWDVLVVDNPLETGHEFQTLSDNVKEIQGEAVNYARVFSPELKDETLGNYDVVFIGWNATSHVGTYFRQDDAALIAAYVEAGGVVATNGTDDGGWSSDWLPAPCSLVNTGDYGLEVTEEGKELFNNPNAIDASIVMDERYASIDEKYTVLAWGQGLAGKEAGSLQIALGKGLYFIIAIDNRNAGNAQLNLKLMENMLNYAVKHAQGASVELTDKLPVTWGDIKGR